MEDNEHIDFRHGQNELVNLIEVMIEDANIDISTSVNTENVTTNLNKLSTNVFLVHGHNEEMKQSVARFIEKIGLKPIILHEQPNLGRTIIEKFTDYSNVNFAIILLSADDIAFKRTENIENSSYRARQNVIFELGFFIGKIGRENVFVLYEQEDNFEIPSDYQGVLYNLYDRNGNWRQAIVKELKASGYEIDANKLYD